MGTSFLQRTRAEVGILQEALVRGAGAGAGTGMEAVGEARRVLEAEPAEGPRMRHGV